MTHKTALAFTAPSLFLALPLLPPVVPAAGAQPTSDQRWSVVLDKGTTATVNFGSRAIGDKAGASTESSGAIGLLLAAAVLGGIGVMIYRQRQGKTGIS